MRMYGMSVIFVGDFSDGLAMVSVRVASHNVYVTERLKNSAAWLAGKNWTHAPTKETPEVRGLYLLFLPLV